jgi:flavin-binding protein dodecin
LIIGNERAIPALAPTSISSAKTEVAMSNHVYKKLEVVGSSPNSIEEAINTAIAKTGETVKNLRWFEVVQLRGEIADNKAAHFQVTMKLGFTFED